MIAYALSGMEFVGMMGAEIRDPARIVKPVIFVSTAFVALFHVATTTALLVIAKPDAIEPLHGLADAGNVVARMFGWAWITPLIAPICISWAAPGKRSGGSRRP